MSIKKIGVYFLEGNGRGDVLLLTPALRGLRKKYPDAFIGCVLKYPELLNGNPNIDKTWDATANNRAYLHELCQDADLHFYVDYGRYVHSLLPSIHIIDLFCKLCGVTSDTRKLDLYLTEKELETGRAMIENAKLKTKKKKRWLFKHQGVRLIENGILATGINLLLLCQKLPSYK